MGTSLKPIDSLLKKASECIFRKDNAKEDDCYKKIHSFYSQNYEVLDRLFLFQVEKERFYSALETVQIMKEVKYNTYSLNKEGFILRKLQNWNASKVTFKESLDINNSVYALLNLGNLFFDEGNLNEAERHFKEGIKLENDNFEFYLGLGNVCRYKKNYKKSKEYYRKAIELNPQDETAYSNLFLLEIEDSKDFKEIQKLSEQCHTARVSTINNNTLISKKILPYQLFFENQQAEYFKQEGILKDGQEKFLEVSNKILSQNTEDTVLIELSENEISTINSFRLSKFPNYRPKEINSFINKENNWKKIEEKYLESRDSYVVIDNFLDKEAIRELRRFCLETGIWILPYPNQNYIGAMCSQGNFSSIHMGIINDLKQNLSKILKNKRIEQLWAFNYDNRKSKGIDPHADFADVNLNFWITPDEYLNKKNTGGLRIYQKSVPEDWTFNDYNKTDGNKINKFIKNNKIKYDIIPYKYNRAILFNSSLVHETEELSFHEDFVSRRINFTMLFGRKENN